VRGPWRGEESSTQTIVVAINITLINISLTSLITLITQLSIIVSASLSNRPPPIDQLF
jgi:hypothetical protein